MKFGFGSYKDYDIDEVLGVRTEEERARNRELIKLVEELEAKGEVVVIYKNPKEKSEQ